MILKQLYYIAIIPPEPVKKQVKSIKQCLKQEFGLMHSLKSPAHITLQMPFKRTEDCEDSLLPLLADFSKTLTDFDITLNGFGHFGTRVLYIAIENHMLLKQIHNNLQTVLTTSFNLSREETNGPFHPHMTIATRDLRKEYFDVLWPKYKLSKYEAAFTAKSLYLLKHNGKVWDLYKEFPFQKKQ